MIFKQIYFNQKNERVKIDLTQNSNNQTLVFESMDWAIPAGASCNIFVNKPDGHLVYNGGTISGNEMAFELTTQMTAVPGIAGVQIQIVADDKILNSFVIEFDIEETIIDGTAVESSDEYSVLDALITDATAAIADCEDATADAIAAAQEARVPVKVGARNLIVNTLKPSSTYPVKLKNATGISYGSVGIAYSDDGVDVSTLGSSSGYYALAQASSSETYGIEPGEYYTLDFDYSGSGSFSVCMREYYSSSWHNTGEEDLTPAVGAQHFSKTYKLDDNMTGFTILFNLDASTSIRLSNIQFEHSTVPSEYRPATEDITVPLIAMASQMTNLIVAETKQITTNSNWYVLSKKTDYALAACYRIGDNSTGYITGISQRSSGDYTLIFEGISSATTLSIYVVWAKIG